ncbi:MAG: NHL domain-containing protein [Candidatus Sulfotelmatobacter sp.]
MRPCTKIFANLLTAMLLALPALAQQDVINTVIGGGPSGMPAIDADVNLPVSVSVDSSNNYYIADQGNRVFKVASTGELTLVAGTGFTGYSGDGVTGGAAQAALDNPQGAVADAAGNIYISDTNNCVVRKVDSTNTITTIAGEGPSGCGYNGETSTDGKPATAHMLYYPEQLALDSSGANLYIADYYNCRIRKVVLATDAISTVAGTGSSPICGYTSGSPIKAIAAELDYPTGVAVDSSGNLFIADTGNYLVRKVTASNGNITNVAGTPPTSANGGYTVCTYNPPTYVCGDGAAATSAALGSTYYLAVNSAGTSVTISDYYNFRIRQFAVGGKINTVVGSGSAGFCGDGGPALSACLYYEQGVAVDSSGDIYIADYDNYRIRAVNTQTSAITLAGVSIPAGDIQTVGGNGSATLPNVVTDVPALGVVLYNPFGVTEDASGNIFTSDTYNHNVREDVGGTVNIIAGTGVPGYSGDGGPATSAQLYYPYGVARDSSGNTYIADQENCLIRKVDTSGTITTFAGLVSGGSPICGYIGDGGPATSAQLYYPTGVAVDSSNHVWIADTYNHRIREVVSGTINTVAGNGTAGYSGDGGLATAAELYYPYDMRVDASGNIFIADTYNCRIRQVNATTKVINTIAGNGACTFSGDGQALENSLSYPSSLAVDANDNVFIGDTSNNRVRWLDPAGTITTFAGSSAGFSGDGGVATSAELYNPMGVFEDSSGNFLVADYYNYRVRGISAFNAVGRSVSNMAFGLQTVNTTSNPELATLSGIGSATISSITTTGPFAEADNCVSLTNGATCEIYVFFTPTGAGTVNGTLTITDNGFLGTTQTISLRGTGAGVAVTPATINFGTELLKVATASKAVTIKNDSTTTITGLSVSLINTADFAIASNTCGATLASKASCTVGVTFAPQSINARKGTLVVMDSDPSSPQIVGLSGVGTEVEFSETTVNFGSVVDGTTATQNVTLTNVGSTALTITKGTLSGTNAADFTAPANPPCGGTVSSNGGTCTLTFTFKPSKVAAESATWTLSDNGGGGTQKLTLTGTGTAATK